MIQIEIFATLKLEHTCMLNGYPDELINLQKKYASPNTKPFIYRYGKGSALEIRYIGKPDKELEQNIKEDFEEVQIFTYNEFQDTETDLDSVQGCLDAIQKHRKTIHYLQERIDELV